MHDKETFQRKIEWQLEQKIVSFCPTKLKKLLTYL